MFQNIDNLLFVEQFLIIAEFFDTRFNRSDKPFELNRFHSRKKMCTSRRSQIGGGTANRFDPAQKQDGKLLKSGFIALQSEGQEIDFMNIRLLNLERSKK